MASIGEGCDFVIYNSGTDIEVTIAFELDDRLDDPGAAVRTSPGSRGRDHLVTP
jgi:hypothetical protein